ncbi:MAG: SufS family cysteine desulfurase [Acidiferrobacterales bacterium]|nr:SufS family cysteine desulfurase [Acidiferrobacterales bacterium]
MTQSTLTADRERTANGTIDPHAIREQFPILSEIVYGKNLVYLDNAASSQKPLAVTDALNRYYASQHANVHRGVHALSDRATEAYETARSLACQFVNAEHAKEIIFVRGTTEGLNLVASSYGRQTLRPGDEILVSEMEHHSNIVPWQIIAEQTGSRVRMIPMDDSGQIIQQEYLALLNENTAIVAITYVANSLGTVNPIKQMTQSAHEFGAVVVVDAAQAAPHIEIDVRELGCDFLTLSGHKMYGPTGIGILYGREELLEAMPPYQGGGEMIKRVTFAGSEYADIPHKFEAGTPNIADSVGFGAAVKFMWSIGFDAIASHENQLLEYCHERAGQHSDIRIFGQAPHKSGVFAFEMDGIHAHDVGTIVDRDGVAIRVGHHCAMPVMRHFNVSATARASFAVYNSIDDIDLLFDALDKARELFRG